MATDWHVGGFVTNVIPLGLCRCRFPRHLTLWRRNMKVFGFRLCVLRADA